MNKRKRILVVAIVLFIIAVSIVYYGVHINKKDNIQSDTYESEIAVYNELKTTENERTQEDSLLDNAYNLNPDTIAWLFIPGTKIDFPIVQTDNNEYYLKYSFTRETPSNGVPFLDYRCESDFNGFNSIIYGHNISRDRMFSGLLKFKQDTYFNEHNTAVLKMKTGDRRVRFFACLVTNSTSDIYQVVFLTDKEKEEYINIIKSNAVVWDDSVKIHLDSNMILLSTCSYDFDEARTVVVGILE